MGLADMVFPLWPRTCGICVAAREPGRELGIEHDDLAKLVARCQGVEGGVDVLQPDAARNQPLDRQPAFAPQPFQERNVTPGNRRTKIASDDAAPLVCP